MLCDSIEYVTFLVKHTHIAALYPNPSHCCNGDTLSPSLPFSMGSETVEPVSGLLLDLGDYSRVMFSTLHHIFLAICIPLLGRESKSHLQMRIAFYHPLCTGGTNHVLFPKR